MRVRLFIAGERRKCGDTMVRFFLNLQSCAMGRLAWLKEGLALGEAQACIALLCGVFEFSLVIWEFSDPLHKPQVTLALLDCRA